MKFHKISQISNASESDDDALDLAKPLHSLSHYVDDEEELISQMFKALKFKKLKAMLPPVLRNAPVEDIKRLFVQELSGMSRTRILASINGEEVNTSSSDSDLSESEFDMSESNSETEASFKPVNIEAEELSNEYVPKAEEEESNFSKDGADTTAKGGASTNLTTLDLIELEMRAKLIKTMLEKQPNDDVDEVMENFLNVKIKEEPASPELLAGIIKKEKVTPVNSPSSCKRSSSSDRSSSSSKSSARSRRSRSSKNSHSSSNSDSSDSTKKNSAGESKSKRKLTRKEFEERMKKAKLNRSYRKREDSDEDSFDDEDDDNKRKQYKKWKARMQRKLDKKAAEWEKNYFEGMKKDMEIKKAEDNDGEIDEEMEEGEVLEKEEGELESNEEAEVAVEVPEVAKEQGEEGACSPSDRENDAAEEVEGDKNSKLEIKIDGSKSPTGEEIKTSSEKVSRRRRSKRSRRSSAPKQLKKQEAPEVEPDIEECDKEGQIEEISAIIADDNSMSEVNMTLPHKSDRQSISFSLMKKNLNVVRGNGDSDSDSDNNLKEELEDGFLRNTISNEHIEIIGDEPDKDLDVSENVDENVSNSPSLSSRVAPVETSDAKDDSPEQESEIGGATAENSGDSNIDIIGCIEAKGTKRDSDSFDEDLISGSSWSSRWLQSDKVQTVVSDSKIMSKVRKKIQAKGKIERPMIYSAPPQPMPQPVEVARPVKSGNVIGSIEEYEKVIGVKVPKKPVVTRKIALGLESDSEDSEDDALWSKILKK